MEFTPIEQALIDWFVEHAVLPELVAQFRSATPTSRKYTGVGSYTDLAIPAEAPRVTAAIAPPGAIIGPYIFAPEVPHGACTQVYCRGGVLTFLEIATYADPFPEKLANFTLKEVL